MSRTAIVLCVLLVPGTAAAGLNGAWDGAPPQTLLPLILPADGLWYYTAARATQIGPDGEGGWMDVPPQTDLWMIDATGGATLSITDVSVTGDQFEVYLNGYFSLRTPAVLAEQQPQIEPDAPGPVPFQNQAALDSAFADPRYSSGSIDLASGWYLVNVKDISFPPGTGAAGFGVRLTSVPTATDATSWGNVKALFR